MSHVNTFPEYNICHFTLITTYYEWPTSQQADWFKQLHFTVMVGFESCLWIKSQQPLFVDVRSVTTDLLISQHIYRQNLFGVDNNNLRFWQEWATNQVIYAKPRRMETLHVCCSYWRVGVPSIALMAMVGQHFIGRHVKVTIVFFDNCLNTAVTSTSWQKRA